jgi:ArsR family transcriptional regulator
MRAVDGSMLIVEEATRQTNGPFSLEMTEADERVARLAKALGHPARVALLRHLMRLGECVCTDLSDVLPLAHSTAMQHIKVLKEAGLLVSAKEGRNVVYCVDRGILGQLKGLIAEL